MVTLETIATTRAGKSHLPRTHNDNTKACERRPPMKGGLDRGPMTVPMWAGLDRGLSSMQYEGTHVDKGTHTHMHTSAIKTQLRPQTKHADKNSSQTHTCSQAFAHQMIYKCNTCTRYMTCVHVCTHPHTLCRHTCACMYTCKKMQKNDAHTHTHTTTTHTHTHTHNHHTHTHTHTHLGRDTYLVHWLAVSHNGVLNNHVTMDEVGANPGRIEDSLRIVQENNTYNVISNVPLLIDLREWRRGKCNA